VKSSGYRRHESLDSFQKKYQLKLPEKYVITGKNLSSQDGVTYLPIYMTMCL
jgi:hypothetical protein